MKNAAPASSAEGGQPRFGTLLATTLVYALLGGLGLILAIPPGYASPVFPAAGFAIAVTLRFGPRILPAIWFGSLILNSGVGLGHGSLSVSGLLVAAGIATGSTLQSLVGRWLVRLRLGDTWRELGNERDILHFHLVAGLLACVVSATVGAACLLGAGLVHASEWLFAWWNWYVGDTLGVLLVAPLMVGWLCRDEMSWSRRLRMIVLPTAAMLIAVSVAFFAVARWEQESFSRDIKAHGEKLARVLGNRIVALQEILTSLASFVEVTPGMTVAQFNRYTEAMLDEHPDIAALSYNPLLAGDQRQVFERDLSRRYPTRAPQVTERNAQGKLVPAPLRADYVVVAFIAPFAGNAQAIGFNIESEPIRQEAIKRGRQTGQNVATSQIRLVQDQKDRPGLLVLSPVERVQSQRSAGQPSDPIQGFAVGVIKVDELVEIATQGMLPSGITLEVSDPAAPADKQLLYSSATHRANSAPPYSWQAGLAMADRQWSVRVYPDAAYVQDNHPALAWSVGVVGLLLTSMLQVILLGVTGRNQLIERRVDEQTAQLNEKNRELAKSQARYSSVVSNVKEVIFQTDAHGLWTFLNPAWEEITGYSVATSLGTSLLDYVHPDDRQRNAELLALLIEGKKDHCRHEVRYLRKDGGFRWIEAYARLTPDDDGNTHGTSGTLIDITERKQLNQHLQLAATGFTHAREGIVITTPDATILDVNDAFTVITGYARDEAVGRTPRILSSRQHDKKFYASLWQELKQRGEWHGEIRNRRKNGELYVEMLSISEVRNADGQLQNYIGLFSDITLLKNQQEHLEKIAHFDPLTALPNRLLLADRLNQAMAQALRRKTGLVVAYVDLDGFKQINDHFGHAVGDRVLKGIASNMARVLREGDTLARLGGDEFVVVLLDIEEIGASLHLLDRLLVAAAQPLQIGDHEHQLSASVGATFYPQDEHVDAELLLSQSDQAMYQAKMAGKNRYAVYDGRGESGITDSPASSGDRAGT